MILNVRASLLVGAVALASAVYLPAASAATFDLGNIVVPTTAASQIALGKSVAVGAFSENYNFTLSQSANVSASVGSTATTFSGFFSVLNTGVAISTVSLYQGSNGTGTQIAQLSITPLSNSNVTGVTVAPGLTFPVTETSGTYTGLLSNVLKSNTAYSLVINGTNVGSTPASFSGSLSALTAPVPEPEEWAMMLVGTGLVGYQVSRKQKKLSHSTLA